MNKIQIEWDFYYRHPIYDQYASDIYGRVIDIKNKKNLKPFQIEKIIHGQNHKKECIHKKRQRFYIDFDFDSRIDVRYALHEFVWECFNVLIPSGKMIEHIDENVYFNVLHNLHLLPHELTNFECDCFVKNENNQKQ